MSAQIYWQRNANPDPTKANQQNFISFASYTETPVWHSATSNLYMYFVPSGAPAPAPPPPPVNDSFFVAGNAAANMDTTGLTNLTAVAGVDDGFGYMPLPFDYYFFGTNYSNSSAAAPTLFWNTNQLYGFGTGNAAVTWLANTGPAILMGNNDRRTTTMYYSGAENVSNVNIMNMVFVGRNTRNDVSVNGWQMQFRLARSALYQYVECRISTKGSQNGTWNITDGTTFQNTFGAYAPVENTSFVLRSDLNGSNWVLSNNYYLNL